MSFPLLPLAHALTEFVPLITRWLGRENGHATAHKVVNIAQSITREKEPLHILQSLKADPKKPLEFQQAVQKMAHELDLEEVKDRENARLRDIALAQAGRSNLRADIMVISAALGLIACLVTITLYRMSLARRSCGDYLNRCGDFWLLS